MLNPSTINHFFDTQRKVSRLGVYGIAMQDNKILLVIQDQGPYFEQYDLPGGGMEFGETPEETLRRECFEELGANFKSMKLMNNVVTTHPVTSSQKRDAYVFHRIGLLYQMEELALPENYTAEGILEHVWMPLDELEESNVTPLAWEAVKMLCPINLY